MTPQTDTIHFLEVSACNVDECGIYCIKNKRTPGYRAKVEWVRSKPNKELRIKIAANKQGKQLGFIEYMPSESAWRPIRAANYYFIQCVAVFGKSARHKQIASSLLAMCEEDAKTNGKAGVCTMTSDGPWMADKTLFEKNGFTSVANCDRFALMVKSFDRHAPMPSFIDWTKKRSKYKGWNLLYADQCPWHHKSVTDIKEAALEHGIELKVTKLRTPEQAQNAPSGYGTFNLLHNGKLLGDHYLSRTRFENILRKETKSKLL